MTQTFRTTNLRAGTAQRSIAKIATGFVSVLAVVLATAYLVAPTRTALAISVAVDSAARVPSAQVVIYGKATSDRGKALAGLRISVSRGLKVGLAITSRADGTFRGAAVLKGATYVVAASRTVSGKAHMTKVSVKLKPGRAYRITVRIVHSGGLAILPVRSY